VKWEGDDPEAHWAFGGLPVQDLEGNPVDKIFLTESGKVGKKSGQCCL